MLPFLVGGRVKRRLGKGGEMAPEGFLLAGLLLLLLGILLLALGMWGVAERGRVEGGGVVVMGPFPIAFGTSEGMARAMAAVGFVLVLLFFFLLLRGWKGF
jgi:uncharacterized protein (TIGR00304 family)